MFVVLNNQTGEFAVFNQTADIVGWTTEPHTTRNGKTSAFTSEAVANHMKDWASSALHWMLSVENLNRR